VNESHWNKWAPGIQRVVAAFKNGDAGRVQAKNARYIGSLVADIHRKPHVGRRLLVSGRHAVPGREAAAALRSGAARVLWSKRGGAATDGRGDILDIKPTALHQRTPLIIGSKQDVASPARCSASHDARLGTAAAPAARCECAGEPPFTRGIYRRCTAASCGRCASTRASAPRRETNARFRHLLDAGQTGLSVAFDLPTQMGYDSDHRMAEGEVGRAGVAIDSVEDLERLSTAFRSTRSPPR